MFWHCVFFLSHFVLATCNQDELLNCRPRSGCKIAQCDPVPGWHAYGVSVPQDYDYPILCQHPENRGNPTKLEKQFKELQNKFDDFQKENANLMKELNKLEGRVERTEDEEDEMKSKIDAFGKQNRETSKQLGETKNELLSKFDDIQKENAGLKKGLNKLEVKMKRIEDEMKSTISILQKENSEMKKELRDLNAVSRQAPKDSCDGLKYEGKCFVVTNYTNISDRVNYDGAVEECRRRGGFLGNLNSQSHMDDVVKYILENVLTGHRLDFRTGLNFNTSTRKLTLRDGTAAAELKWWHGRPVTETKWSHFTNVMFLVTEDGSAGIYDHSPSSRYNVFCEI